MVVLAAIRPDSWNIALLVHVLGAMMLVGTLVLASAALIGAWRNDSIALVRLGYRALLWAALPSWILMRIGAAWILSKEYPDNATTPSWVDFGFITSEPGLLLMVIATVLTGLAVRRAGRGDSIGSRGRVAAVIVSILIAVYVVAIWAMTTKPT